MERNSLKIINRHSSSIPDQRNHNTIFMILQLFFTLPLALILLLLIFFIEKKNQEIIFSFNELTNFDIQKIEKKYRRYFSFQNKQKKKLSSK